MQRLNGACSEGPLIGPWQLHLEEEGMHVLDPQEAGRPVHLVVGNYVDQFLDLAARSRLLFDD